MVRNLKVRFSYFADSNMCLYPVYDARWGLGIYIQIMNQFCFIKMKNGLQYLFGKTFQHVKEVYLSPSSRNKKRIMLFLSRTKYTFQRFTLTYRSEFCFYHILVWMSL